MLPLEGPVGFSRAMYVDWKIRVASECSMARANGWRTCWAAMRRVRGSLFVDYVKMVRSMKKVDWTQYLEPADQRFIDEPVDLTGWYPMETFERLGVGILGEVARGQLEAVRMWGRFQVDALRRHLPDLVAEGDPRDTLYRFQTLRRGMFDYDAVDIAHADDEQAKIRIAYGMGVKAEEAAAHQARGFFERLLEIAGATDISSRFLETSWTGAPTTTIELAWAPRSG